jgi:hypothetical protein
MKRIDFDESTVGESTGPAGVTFSILATCEGVTRLVQGFTDDVERDAKAEALFADVMKGEYVPPVVKEYDEAWSDFIDVDETKIDAVEK